MRKLSILVLAAALMLFFTACQQTTNVYLDWDGNASVSISGNVNSSEDSADSENESQGNASSEDEASSDSSSKTESSGKADKKPANSSSKDESKPSGTSGTSSTGTPSQDKDKEEDKPSTPPVTEDDDNEDKDDDKDNEDDDEPQTPPKPTEYKVTFNSKNGGTSSEKTTVNGKIAAPAEPQRAGYKFLGWYKQDSNTPWDFSVTISQNITLIAKWEIIEFKVTFDPKNDDDDAFQLTTVNHKISAPAAPEKENCNFTGWYLKGTSTKWDFNTEILEDITLVAEWELTGDHTPIIPF